MCFERKFVIEVDGGQHNDAETDRRRDALLKAEGFRVVRYWNSDVLRNPEGVLTDLVEKLALK